MAATMGLSSVVLKYDPTYPNYPEGLSPSEVAAGLPAAAAAQVLLKEGGAALLLILLVSFSTSALSSLLFIVAAVLVAVAVATAVTAKREPRSILADPPNLPCAVPRRYLLSRSRTLCDLDYLCQRHLARIHTPAREREGSPPRRPCRDRRMGARDGCRRLHLHGNRSVHGMAIHGAPWIARFSSALSQPELTTALFLSFTKFMGVVIGAGVVPIALAIMSSRANRYACAGGAVFGTSSAVSARALASLGLLKTKRLIRPRHV